MTDDKHWFVGVFKNDFEGDFEGYTMGSLGGCFGGTCRGTQKLTCCQAQVRSRSGSVYSSNDFL